ncbi:MAG: GPR endopeptidase [Lachnospiraceae bacterium]|nr:GPR endopeptidase [Lachnospiraceae bacterium]
MEKHGIMEKRTDLALEVRESFPEDDVEVSGVKLTTESLEEGKIQITTVEILNEHGAEEMGKPVGTYITLEFEENYQSQDQVHQSLIQRFADILQEITKDLVDTKKKLCLFVTGLGNRFATPDALGPYVVEHISVNRHLETDIPLESGNVVCAVVPGVMSQTGLETGEILGGIIARSKPDLLLVIDALATRSVKRLCRTIQITDTGILPGAGVGNHRYPINQDTMGIPVIAIGVPTVVEANTIVLETMEEVLQREQCTEEEIALFLENISRQAMSNLFVTPKDIEAQISQVGDLIAQGINRYSSMGN